MISLGECGERSEQHPEFPKERRVPQNRQIHLHDHPAQRLGDKIACARSLLSNFSYSRAFFDFLEYQAPRMAGETDGGIGA
jgi:hypothetical protein